MTDYDADVVSGAAHRSSVAKLTSEAGEYRQLLAVSSSLLMISVAINVIITVTFLFVFIF